MCRGGLPPAVSRLARVWPFGLGLRVEVRPCAPRWGCRGQGHCRRRPSRAPRGRRAPSPAPRERSVEPSAARPPRTLGAEETCLPLTPRDSLVIFPLALCLHPRPPPPHINQLQPRRLSAPGKLRTVVTHLFICLLKTAEGFFSLLDGGGWGWGGGGGLASGSEKLFLFVAAVRDQVSACFLSRCRFPFCLTARIVLHGALCAGCGGEADGGRKR